MSGRVVRYVAPDAIKERDTYTITYVAAEHRGQARHRTPDGHGRAARATPTTRPSRPTLEGRVISADPSRSGCPGIGVDRNGDPVTVTGITSAPRLGRIVSFGGNFLEYQAYPRTVGTDEFTYSVVDSQGAFADRDRAGRRRGAGTARSRRWPSRTG